MIVLLNYIKWRLYKPYLITFQLNSRWKHIRPRETHLYCHRKKNCYTVIMSQTSLYYRFYSYFVINSLVILTCASYCWRAGCWLFYTFSSVLCLIMLPLPVSGTEMCLLQYTRLLPSLIWRQFAITATDGRRRWLED